MDFSTDDPIVGPMTHGTTCGRLRLAPDGGRRVAPAAVAPAGAEAHP